LKINNDNNKRRLFWTLETFVTATSISNKQTNQQQQKKD